MRIILTQNVPNLGSLGDEVQVKNGYARNFLLPRGMAISATGTNAAQLAHHRQHLERMRQEAVKQAQSESEKVSGLELAIKVKAGQGGKLYGSVTNRDIQALLAAQGYEIERKYITLLSPVKSLGNYTATVRLHSEVKVDLQFRVEPEGELIGKEEEQPEEGAEEAAEGAQAAAGEGQESAAEASAEQSPAEQEAAPTEQ
ncbi:MAG: 50S ribosomal protein L9 [Deltaproteobacteria bacterium]|nr:50S ribosomal protein L9 [Deltaproteobacteria bacterium]